MPNPWVTDPRVRFDAKVDRSGGVNACHPWTASTQGGGYGQFSRGGRGTNVLAHRFAWELANGAIPDGLFVLHRCDNRLCCNVLHLFLGTQADNLADMDRKGRRKPPSNYGEASGMAKLSADEVLEIRERYAAGSTQMQLSAEFGISQSSVSAIVLRKTWPHI